MSCKVCLLVCSICVTSVTGNPLPTEVNVNFTTRSNRFGRQAGLGSLFTPLRPSFEQLVIQSRQFQCGVMTFFGVGDMCPIFLGSDTAPPEGIRPFGGIFQPFQQMFQGIAPAAPASYANNAAAAASPASSDGLNPFGRIVMPFQQLLQGIAVTTQPSHAVDIPATTPNTPQTDKEKVNSATFSDTGNIYSVPNQNQLPSTQVIFPAYYSNYLRYGYPWGYYSYPAYAVNYYPQLYNSLPSYRRDIYPN